MASTTTDMTADQIHDLGLAPCAVGDVLGETRRRVAESGATSIDEVRAAGSALVGFSGQMQAEERALKRFLYARLYDAAELRASTDPYIRNFLS